MTEASSCATPHRTGVPRATRTAPVVTVGAPLTLSAVAR